MMFTTWIPPIEAELRLDAAFYTPKYVAASRRIHAYRRTTTFEKIRKARTPISYGVIKPQPVSKGAYMIRNTDFDAPGIAPGKVVQISESQSNEFRRSIVKSGDLLVTIGGYVGTSAVVTPNLDGGNINQHIARVSLERDIGDPYFYWAFVASTTGRMVLERWVSGTAQPGINLGDLKSLPIPWPDIELQQAIGNKVRKAERLRELAEAALTAAQKTLNEALCWKAESRKDRSKANWTFANDLRTVRLDAKYYQPVFVEARRVLNKTKGTQALGGLADSVSNGVEIRDFVSDGLPYLVVGNIDSGDLQVDNAPRIAANSDVPAKARLSAQDLLVVRTGSVGQAAEVLEEDCADSAVISSHFIRIRLNDPSRSSFISAYLNSELGQLLQDQISYGAVQPQIGQDELGDLPIPDLGKELEQKIGSGFTSWRRFRRQAATLIDAAKADVEALISNTLNLDALHAESSAIESWLTANPSPSV